MILPEIKRIVRFEAMQGKTIEGVREGACSVRLVFTDGTFADIESDGLKVVLYRKPSRMEKRRERYERG